MAKQQSNSLPPSVIERLIAHFGTMARVAAALEVSRNYITRWRREKFIPEAWALSVLRLGVADDWGLITHMEVLKEAETFRNARIAAALERG